MAKYTGWLLAALVMASNVLFATSIADDSIDRAKNEGPSEGMKIVGGRAPRISMQTLNDVNKLMKPLPAAWPVAFSVDFWTNVTSAKSAKESQGIKGRLYYEEGKGQRIFHAAGSVEVHDAICLISQALGSTSRFVIMQRLTNLHNVLQCVKFYSSSSSCELIFNQVGMFAQVDDMCCLDIPGLHAPPANWTIVNPVTFIGTKRMLDRMCHGFSYVGGDQVSHEYWQDSKTRLPCAFSFVVDPSMTWYFNVSSFIEAPQDSSLFQVSDDCSTRCKDSVSVPGKRTGLPTLWGETASQRTQDFERDGEASLSKGTSEGQIIGQNKADEEREG